MKVESESNVMFYDKKVILLTHGEYLREGYLDEVFKNPNTSILE